VGCSAMQRISAAHPARAPGSAAVLDTHKLHKLEERILATRTLLCDLLETMQNPVEPERRAEHRVCAAGAGKSGRPSTPCEQLQTAGRLSRLERDLAGLSFDLGACEAPACALLRALR
jgi:hypothetical protein